MVVLSEIQDANLRIFSWWLGVMVIKILGMVFFIGRGRFNKKIFLSPEDVMFIKGSKAGVVDEEIERPRRAHLNDLENIIPWAISTLLWLTTSPDPAWAGFLIKTYGISRIIHTFVYAAVVVPQPARFLAFGVGYLITIYQSLSTIYYYS